jgi:hypothetical protein
MTTSNSQISFFFTVFLATVCVNADESRSHDESLQPETIIDKRIMSMNFHQVKASTPAVKWIDIADDRENTYKLRAENAFYIANAAFSIQLTAGEIGLSKLDSIWRGHNFGRQSCERIQLLSASDIEKRLGPLNATSKSSFSTEEKVVRTTYRIVSTGSNSKLATAESETIETEFGNIGGYVEWRGEQIAENLKIELTGYYYGEKTLLAAKGDCGIHLSIRNLIGRPKKIIDKVPTVLVPTKSN